MLRTLVDNVHRRQENMGNVSRENEDTMNIPKRKSSDWKEKKKKTVAEKKNAYNGLSTPHLVLRLKKDSFSQKGSINRILKEKRKGRNKENPQ